MAIEFPGKSHTSVGLDIFLRRKGRGLNRRNPSGGSGQRELVTTLRERPHPVISVTASKRVLDVHICQLVFDRLIGTDCATKGEALQRVIARLRQR